MSSSFRYTLTKDLSLPSSVYRCFLRSGCFAVSASSACPTVDASTPTVSCLSVYTRKGVGIWIFIAKSSLESLGEFRRYRNSPRDSKDDFAMKIHIPTPLRVYTDKQDTESL